MGGSLNGGVPIVGCPHYGGVPIVGVSLNWDKGSLNGGVPIMGGSLNGGVPIVGGGVPKVGVSPL